MSSYNFHADTDNDHQLWKLQLTTSQHQAQMISEKLEDFSLSSAWFDSNNGIDIWHCDVLFAGKPDIAWLEDIIQGHDYTLIPLAHHNWIEENQAAFPPLEIGRFYIHGSHIIPPLQTDRICFEINAATAFGTGEHATTQGCLLLLEHLEQQHECFQHILDLGCGTGILGMAASAIFKQAPVLLTDNDPEAVEVTQSNLVKNNFMKNTEVKLSDGFDDEIFKNSLPFDLIIANILAAPLIALAPDMAHYCAAKGHIILSGLLVSQMEQVTDSYQKVGFNLVHQEQSGEWTALLFIKNKP